MYSRIRSSDNILMIMGGSSGPPPSRLQPHCRGNIDGYFDVHLIITSKFIVVFP